MFVMYADKNRLTVRQREPVTSGSVNVYEAQFEFSPDWNGMIRTAVFRAGGKIYSVLLVKEDRCAIPWEVLAKPNTTLQAGVCGTRSGAVVLPTIWANLGTILEGAATGEDARPPTPDLWQQELERKGDALDYDGLSLSLMSGDNPLSTVKIAGGGGVPVPGPPGEPGKDGATFIPSVSEDGVLSWTNDGGLEDPEPVDIKGPKGDKGNPGEAGPSGPPGEPGSPGKDAAINGKNTLEIVAGENVSIEQEGGTLTISATSGGSSGDEIYSTEETRIGTWIDGKPIYRRVIQGITFQQNSSKQYSQYGTKALNIDCLVNVFGTICSNTGDFANLPFVQYASATVLNVNIYVHVDANGLYAANVNNSAGSIWNTATATVTLEYTKTTD